MSGPAGRKVVFAADLVGGALIDPECARVLELWREGFVMPVVSRELLRRYLRLLDQLGVTPPVLARWTLWFTAPTRAVFLENTPTVEGERLEESALAAGGAGCVIYREAPIETRSQGSAVSAKDFLEQFARPHG